MTSNWKECKIENLNIQIIDGDRGKNYPNKQELLDNGDCLFLSAQNVTKNGFNFNETQWITKERDNLLRNGKLVYGDIVITTRGTVGNVALYSKDIKYESIRINSGMLIVRCGEGIFNDYIYYVLSSQMFAKKIASMQTGTAQPQLPKSHFQKMEILLPPLETQQKIAKVLSAIDDKIELNNSINKNLEQQAQAIYKSWFVDFEPFGGVMPDDWKIGKLQEYASEVIRGFTSKYVEKSNLVNLNQKVNKGRYLEKQYYKFLDETISVPKEKYARKKDILLNSLGQGTLGRIHFWYETSTNVVIDQHITIIRAKEGETCAEYLYLLLNSSKYAEYFESCITGTTGMLMLNISAVRNTDIMLPSFEIQENFSNIVATLYEKIEQNNQENTRLTQLRDTLLPKLMSGEIDVSNVDISTDKLSFREIIKTRGNN